MKDSLPAVPPEAATLIVAEPSVMCIMSANMNSATIPAYTAVPAHTITVTPTILKDNNHIKTIQPCRRCTKHHCCQFQLNQRSGLPLPLPPPLLQFLFQPNLRLNQTPKHKTQQTVQCSAVTGSRDQKEQRERESSKQRVQESANHYPVLTNVRT